MKLEAPPSYYLASDEERADVCNGCGPHCWKHDLVPDVIFGVSISEACNIHDWCYYEGCTVEDRREADELFLRNMRAIVLARRDALLPLRWAAVWWYYRAVRRFGGFFFVPRRGACA